MFTEQQDKLNILISNSELKIYFHRAGDCCMSVGMFLWACLYGCVCVGVSLWAIAVPEQMNTEQADDEILIMKVYKYK